MHHQIDLGAVADLIQYPSWQEWDLDKRHSAEARDLSRVRNPLRGILCLCVRFAAISERITVTAEKWKHVPQKKMDLSSIWTYQEECFMYGVHGREKAGGWFVWRGLKDLEHCWHYGLHINGLYSL